MSVSDDDLRELDRLTQNLLDGMRVNREGYARRVRALMAEVQQLRRQVAEDSGEPLGSTIHVSGSDFSSVIDDLLGGKR
jgi:hypothetical protein